MALGLVIAVAVAAIAYADGTGDNTPGVVGKISPKKLDKQQYKPVNLLTGVETSGPVDDNGCHPSTGGQCNPEAELISFGSNLKWDSNAAPFCSASLNGTTTDQAKALCPGASNIGSGTASIAFPGGTTVTDEVVTVFNGPQKNELRLHAYSPTLTATNTQVIDGEIVKAPPNGRRAGKYGQALKVADAPDAAGDAAMITSFNAKIKRSTKVAKARCKAKKFRWKRTVTYDDGSQESVELLQNCTRKGG